MSFAMDTWEYYEEDVTIEIKDEFKNVKVELKPDIGENIKNNDKNELKDEYFEEDVKIKNQRWIQVWYKANQGWTKARGSGIFWRRC